MFGAADPDAVAVRLGSLMRGLAVHVALGKYDVTAAEMVGHCLDTPARELDCDPDALRAAAGRLEERRVA